MKKLLLNTGSDFAIIHFDIKDGRITGSIYPANKGRLDNKIIYSYEECNCIYNENDNIENSCCRKYLNFSFCWRGIWEGRIYFQDDEYWSEELNIISNIWAKLLPILKNTIKTNNPGGYYEE